MVVEDEEDELALSHWLDEKQSECGLKIVGMAKSQMVNGVTTKGQSGHRLSRWCLRESGIPSVRYTQVGCTERRCCKCGESLQEEISQIRGMAGW